MNGEILADVLRTYRGSDGAATKALFARLEPLGPVGSVAVNLYRACKASERAKVYRRGYSAAAYDKKQWSMDNLCRELVAHADEVGIEWGWGFDEKAKGFEHVLYIEIPTGQVSFHSERRGDGPDYGKPWDGVRHSAAGRICAWIGRLLDEQAEAQAA